MGRLVLIARLAVRDLRHRPVETVLVLLAITAAAATLSLGLVLHGVSVGPSYQQTRAATRGPDVVATDISASQLPAVRKQAAAAGAGAIGGPYPVAVAVLRAGGYTAQVTAQGRDQAGAAIDQPLVWQGTWVRPGGVVIERSFADALGVHVGDQVQLNGRRFLVAGIAITAASPPYPETGFLATPPAAGDSPGLVWLTRADTRALATAATPLTYTVSVRTPGPAQTRKLAGPSGFQGNWTSARAIAAQDAKEVQNEQLVLEVGSWLLGLLALATLAVLVGGRMADQTRRVGLLKAVGGTPGLVATVLLAEYLVLAVVAAAAGLTAGRLIAPSLTSLSFFAGLTVAPAEPALTTGTIALVVGVALTVVTVATLVPAARAARTSTVSALADSARPPRRHGWLIAFSSRLPVPLLLGLRLAARRPRRSLLSGVSIAITVATIVAVLVYRVSSGQQPSGGTGAAAGPPGDPVGQVMLVVTVVLVVLAAVNAIFVTWATTLDARYPSALAAALGATPGQLAAGFSAAQLLPALPGVIIGIPAGVGLYAAVSRGGAATIPPGSWLLAVGIGTLLALAVLTAIPVGIGVRRPVSPVLQAE